jgi:flavorubredoxin
LTPFSASVSKKIEEVLALKLPVSMIAPSHGVIWRKDPLQIVTKYQEWASQQPEKAAVVVYSSMWNATRLMAESVGEGLSSEGVANKVFRMPTADVNDVVAEVFKARAVIVGSSTHNQGVLPSITALIEELRTLKFRNKIGAAFGSYGWSGESVKIIEEHLAQSKIAKAAEGVLVKWHPGAQDIARCRELGAQVAKAVKAG